MNNIVTVTGPSEFSALTTVDRVKAELSIKSSDHDTLLQQKINEASSDIEAHTGRTFARETISEQFLGADGGGVLMLDRYPLASVTSVTLDGIALDLTTVKLDAKNGLLFRLDASSYDIGWTWCRDLVVVYSAGYLLPGQQGRDLPPALEAGTVDLVKSFWLSRGRDANVKSVNVPGVIQEEYWVGAVGQEGSLPPSVLEKISPFRRASL